MSSPRAEFPTGLGNFNILEILKNLLVLTVLLEVFPAFGLLILASVAFHLLLGGLLGHVVSKETLMTEAVAGVWSAFHLHKWLLFFISKLLQVVARVVLTYSYSSAPALLLVLGVFLVFNGLSSLQDQDDVDGNDGAVEVMEEDKSDSMVDLVDNNLGNEEEEEDSFGSQEVTAKTMRSFVDKEEKDTAEEESDEKNMVFALLDELLTNVDVMSLKE